MLCEDLLGEIFERLPPKTLIRFRCLSKSWCSSISSPYFIRMHSFRSSSRKVIIRHYNNLDDTDDDDDHNDDDDFSKDLYSLHSEDQISSCQNGPKDFDDISTTVEFPCNHRSKVVNSCNGILCLHDLKSGGIISLWNPSIRRKLILPDQKPCCIRVSRGVPGIGVTVGFGFDPISNDYKIVRISYMELKVIVLSSSVYSTKTRVWSPIAFPSTPFDFIKSRACFLNGALHWVAVYFSEPMDYYIMTFNLTTHVFGKITLAKPSWIARKPTIVNGCLAVMSYESEANAWIWVMKEYNNVASWYVLFKIKTHPFDRSIKNVMQVPTTNCADYFLISYYPHELQLYNLATGVSSLLKNKFHKVYMDTCRETLELLDESSAFES